MDFADESLIAARSKREAMDFALVLTSQSIQSTVLRIEDGWAVAVDAADFGKAQEVLGLWKKENHGWKWRKRLPQVAGAIFHPGCLLWAAALVGFYAWSRIPVVKECGIVDSRAVADGQWWRLFTAVCLHADLKHLLSNLTCGLVLLALAMARFGSGVALLATFLAGAAGNIAGQYFYTQPHFGLGASGMVMGALGLLAIVPPEEGWDREAWLGIVARGVAATFLLLVLMGFSPDVDAGGHVEMSARVDVVAHVGGYIGGILSGLALSRVPLKLLRGNAFNMTAAIILATLLVITWRLAIRPV